MSGLRSAPVLALLFSLVALPAHAQTPLADAATAWYVAHPGFEVIGTEPAAAAVDAPASAQGDDGHFPLLLAAFITAASADLAVSMYQIGRGAAHEAAFGSAWEHAPVPFALSKSGAAALFALGVQHMHKDRPKAAFILGLSATVIESMLVVRAARMSSTR